MQKIILDSDPGHDDAIAIMLAAAKTELLGISVVSGNQTIEKTTANTLKVCEFIRKNIPVYRGCGVPLVRSAQETAENVHGESGLEGVDFAPVSSRIQQKHSVLYMAETFLKSNGDIILVPTGPLTNIALMLKLYPEVKVKIKRIVLMGGAYQTGNITPAAEFNIYSDPEAAYVVFESGCPITMIGLDVTRKVLCYDYIIERMRKIGNRASELFCGVMTAYNRYEKEVYGLEGAPLHDPVTVASIIDESLIKTQHMHVEVDITNDPCRGKTVCGSEKLTGKKANADVAVDIDTEKFWDIIEDGIRAYD